MEWTIAAAGRSGHGRSPRIGMDGCQSGAFDSRRRRSASRSSDGALHLRARDPFEDPKPERQADADRPAQGRGRSRRPFRRRERGFDLDRMPSSSRPRTTSRDGTSSAATSAAKVPGRLGCHLLDHQALAARDRSRARAANGGDAARDQPRGPCFDFRDPLEHRLGRSSIVVSTVTSIAIRERPPAGAGTSARVRAARRGVP